MAFNCEDALRLKSMEMAQQCCEDDKSLNQPMVRMTLPPSKIITGQRLPTQATPQKQL